MGSYSTCVLKRLGLFMYNPPFSVPEKGYAKVVSVFVVSAEDCAKLSADNITKKSTKLI